MVLVNYGPDEGKLAVILDVADNNKVGASRVGVRVVFVLVDSYISLPLKSAVACGHKPGTHRSCSGGGKCLVFLHVCTWWDRA